MPRRVKSANIVLINPTVRTMGQLNRRMIYLANHKSSRLNIVLCILLGAFFFSDVKRYRYRKFLTNKRKFKNQRYLGFKYLKLHPELSTKRGIGLIDCLQFLWRNEYRIIVFSNNQVNNIVYRGRSDAKTNIYLCEDGKKKGHYNIIKTPAKYFGYRSFCSECIMFLYSKNNHFCLPKCSKCFQFNCSPSGHHTMCLKCNRFFVSANC